MIVWVSLLFALWINFSMWGTQYWKYLKSSIIDATQTQKNTWDIYLQLTNNGDSIWIKSWKNLSQVTKLSFSLSYNPEGIKIKNITPIDNTITGQNLANTPWYQTVILILQSPKNIQAGETIATIQVEKNSQKIEYINLFSANSEDQNKNITELSSSWIDF